MPLDELPLTELEELLLTELEVELEVPLPEEELLLENEPLRVDVLGAVVPFGLVDSVPPFVELSGFVVPDAVVEEEGMDAAPLLMTPDCMERDLP